MSLANNLMLGAWGLLGTVGLLTMVGAGCSSTETIDPGHLPFEDEATFCQKAAELVCTASVVDACYGSDDASRPDDTNTCQGAFSLNSHCNPFDFDYHQPGAQACLDKLALVYADAKLNSTEEAELTEACLIAFNNGRAEGETCAVDNDCAVGDDFRCVFAPEGTCQVPEEVEGGLNCGAADQVCGDVFYCGDGNCIQRPDLGELCSDVVPCAADARCVIPVDMTEGACEAKFGNNDTCQAADQCAGGFCTIPTGGTDGTCAASVTLGTTVAGSCDRFL
jgi:hypothetical protein